MRSELKNFIRCLLGRRLVADSCKAPLPPAVEAALALPTGDMTAIGADPQLSALVLRAESAVPAYSSRDLFSVEGRPLPCWREEDVGLEDDWVTNPNYYPLYHRLFRETAALRSDQRLLEIGVRTGYVGVCFARAVEGSSYYLGVDPNLYLPDGLARAKATFAMLGAKDPRFRFRCLFGYSDNPTIQRRLREMPKFDLIHIDGDHTLRGKLVDLDLARQLTTPEGLVLVDDYLHIPDVIQEAVGRALRLGWYSRFALLRTTRGMAILQR